MHDCIHSPNEILGLHKEGMGYTEFIKKYLDIIVVEHIDYEGKKEVSGVPYHFFKGRKSFWHLPFNTNKFVSSEEPDIVLIQGLGFPLQVIFLKLFLSS